MQYMPDTDFQHFGSHTRHSVLSFLFAAASWLLCMIAFICPSSWAWCRPCGAVVGVQVMRLALARRKKALAYVSTVGVVGGLDHPGPVLESEDGPSLCAEHPGDNGYAMGCRSLPPESTLFFFLYASREVRACMHAARNICSDHDAPLLGCSVERNWWGAGHGVPSAAVSRIPMRTVFSFL